jgi:uncharacterized membrane protein YgdD (TMEM256/DUF423 family)
MREPDAPSLSPSRRAIVASIIAATLITIAISVHDRTVESRWSNGLGLLLGGLAGTFIGEQLERFDERVAATRIAWLLMAAIAFLLVAIISWQALPAYCQLPVTFAIGVVIGAATIYIQRLRMRMP